MSITELIEKSVDNLKAWFDNLVLEGNEKKIAERLLHEITSRLQFLQDVGLGYLTLNRPSNTLSGGESQRINLTTNLGSSLVGSVYILDEPSIGLHSRDTDKLIHVLRELQKLHNTVIVVEHDEEIMRAADYIVDVGPDADVLVAKLCLKVLLRTFSTKALISNMTSRKTIVTPCAILPTGYYSCSTIAPSLEHVGRHKRRTHEQLAWHRREDTAERDDRSHRCERFGQVIADKGHPIPCPQAPSQRGG